jgi:hypothetical protein
MVTVKVQIPAQRSTFDALGQTDNTIVRAQRVEYTDFQTGDFFTSHKTDASNNAPQMEFQGIPNGDMQVNVFMTTNAGLLTPLVSTINTGGAFTDGTDCGNWYMTLMLECDVVEPTQDQPNPYGA